MTEVTVYENSSGQTIGIEASGHSGQSTQGNDIICASISTIFDFLTKGSNGLPVSGVAIERDPSAPHWYVVVDRPKLESLHWQNFYPFLTAARSLLEDLAERYPEHCQLQVEVDDELKDLD